MKFCLPAKRRIGPDRSRPTALMALLSGAACLVAGAQAFVSAAQEPQAQAAERLRTPAPLARMARNLHLVERASLKQTGEGESSLDEIGRAWGTFNAPLSAHLNLSAGHVSAVFTLRPRGGTITGKASARYVISGSNAYYGGTMNIVRGTGAYRRARGSNIGISGTINRYNFALTVKADGWMQL